MVLYLIAGSLVALVILICVPLKERFAVLKAILRLAFIGLVSYFVVPPVFAFLAACFGSALDAFGWKTLVSVSGFGVFSIAVLLAWRSDRKDNRAIRAGSTVAFDRRVEALMQNKYSREDAVAAAVRVRDGN